MIEQHEFIDGCKDKCGQCSLCCLAVCKHCGLYEGALTTHCSKEVSSFIQSEEIYHGKLNFRGGLWINECSEHSPEFLHTHLLEAKLQFKDKITS